MAPIFQGINRMPLRIARRRILEQLASAVPPRASTSREPPVRPHPAIDAKQGPTRSLFLRLHRYVCFIEGRVKEIAQTTDQKPWLYPSEAGWHAAASRYAVRAE